MSVQQSRATIFDNGDYSLYAEITPTVSPAGGYALTIKSRWKSASKPDEEQVQIKTCLEREGLQNLQSLTSLIGDV